MGGEFKTFKINIMNFALRTINEMTCNSLSEEQLQASEKRIDIIRKNQSYDGLKNYPDISASLKYLSESLLEVANNQERSIANTLSSLTTTVSHLEILIDKLRQDYKKEGEKIKNIINAESQTIS